MLEFVTQGTKVCPYCNNELKFMEVCSNVWKRCEVCQKNFEIAYFVGPYKIKLGDEQIREVLKGENK